MTRGAGEVAGVALLVVASALDGRLIAGLVASPTDAGGFATLFAAHAALALLAAAGFRVALAASFPADARGLAASALAVAFFIPVVGALGFYAALRWAAAATKALLRQPWVRMPVDLEGHEWRPQGRQDASAPALAAILADRSPDLAQRRFHAVLRAMNLPQRASVQILKMALRDPTEEVRLFAFSRLERMRDTLDQAVKDFLGSLERADDDAAREHIHLRLAETFWEFAYLGLAEGSVLDHALARALEHASSSDSFGTRAASASFLRGRVLLYRLEADAATAAFERASRLGYPQQKVLPYLAECAFRNRAVDRVRSYLLRLEEVSRGHAPLARVREFWR
jgi:hypothetical protein